MDCGALWPCDLHGDLGDLGGSANVAWGQVVSVKAYLRLVAELRSAREQAAERGAELSMDREEEFLERLGDIWWLLSSEEQNEIEAQRAAGGL